MKNNVNKILFIDTETGGLDPQEHSLLSIGLVAWHNGEIVDQEEIFVLDSVIKITPFSQQIHKIDFNVFVTMAIQPTLVITKVREFLTRNFDADIPVVLAGHNIGFDIGFLKKLFRADYSQLFSHRSIDTASILKYLFIAGKTNEDYSSSDKAFSAFNISVDGRHSALGDALGTAKLFNKLLELNTK